MVLFLSIKQINNMNDSKQLPTDISEAIKTFTTIEEQRAFIAGAKFGMLIAKNIYNETHNG